MNIDCKTLLIKEIKTGFSAILRFRLQEIRGYNMHYYLFIYLQFIKYVS